MLAVAPITEILDEAAHAAAEPAGTVEIDVVTGEPNLAQDDAVPHVRRSPELSHALGNLIDNAVEFARKKVVLEAGWTRTELRLRIMDDGPGFSASIMGLVGEPYLTTRRGRLTGDESQGRNHKGGMGLGIFIAKDLLERTGAQVTFANARTGGAVVSIAWPRDSFEVLQNGGKR